MRRKRIKPDHGTPVKVDPSVQKLAAVLEAIAGMDALPLAPSPPRRRRTRRGAT